MSSGHVSPPPHLVLLNAPEPFLEGADAPAATDDGLGPLNTRPDGVEALSLFPEEAVDATPRKPEAASVIVPVSPPIEKQPARVVSDGNAVQRLERAADPLSELERVRAAIASSLGEVARLAEIVRNLEHRIAQLTKKNASLERVDAWVGDLERRVASTSAKLEQVARVAGKVGDDLVRPQNSAQSVTTSTRQQVEEVAGRKKRRRPSLSGSSSQAVSVTVLAGLTVLMIAGVMRARAQLIATPLSLAGSPSERQPRPDSSQTLPNRALTAPLVATRVSTPLSTPPTNEGSVAEPVQQEQRTGSTESGTDAVRSPGLTGALSIESRPATAAVYIGDDYVGETPLRLTRIRVGPHLVRIERDGRRWTGVVGVQADKRSYVRATLRAVP